MSNLDLIVIEKLTYILNSRQIKAIEKAEEDKKAIWFQGYKPSHNGKLVLIQRNLRMKLVADVMIPTGGWQDFYFNGKQGAHPIFRMNIAYHTVIQMTKRNREHGIDFDFGQYRLTRNRH